MKAIILTVLLVLAARPVLTQEAIALTTPIAAKPAISNYTPGSLTIILLPSPSIQVVLVATDGTTANFSYPCSTPCAYTTPAQVATLIGQLNTLNLSTRSLWRRLFDRLLIDFPSRFVGGATVQ